MIFDKRHQMGAIINFDEQVQNDTFEERLFAVKRYVSDKLMTLEGATLTFCVFRAGGSRVWLEQPCQIINAAECIFKIPKIEEVALTPYKYNWKVKIVYSNGDVKTYIGGLIPVVQFKTEDEWLRQ